MESNGKTVCMISCLHPLKDDRIYWKEAISLQKNGYKVIHIGVSDKAYDEISDERIRLISIKRKQYFKNPYIDKFYRTFTFKPNIYREILSAAKDVNADVYHTHDLQINRIIKSLKRLAQKPKLIYDVHDYIPDLFISHYKKINPFWILFKLYTIYIKFWEFSRAKYYNFIIPAVLKIEGHFNKHLKHLPTEIIFNYTTLIPKDNSSTQKEFDVIYIGAINKNRGLFEAIQTAYILKKLDKHYRFLFLGPFHHKREEHKARALICKLDLGDNFKLHPTVDYQKVEEYLSKSKIGLSIFKPLNIYYYAVPIKIFEYMANGLPIICSNFGATEKIILESKSGISVNPYNPNEIAQAIIKLIDNIDLYEQMSKSGIKAVKEKYNWENEEKKLINIYSKLLSC